MSVSLTFWEPPLHLASSSRILDLDLPLPPLPWITLPPFYLSPSGIDKMLERQLSSSEPEKDHSNMEVGGAVPDCVLDGLISSAQNGESHSAGDYAVSVLKNYLLLTTII